jgi:hypothetical protein
MPKNKLKVTNPIIKAMISKQPLGRRLSHELDVRDAIRRLPHGLYRLGPSCKYCRGSDEVLLRDGPLKPRCRAKTLPEVSPDRTEVGSCPTVLEQSSGRNHMRPHKTYISVALLYNLSDRTRLQ